jgi:DNA-binding MarR family transcriptional regulator
MSPDVRWLTAQQERVWRRWLTLNARLLATLHKELQDNAGLSMPDYEVLVHLTDRPEGRMRVMDLARLLQWERSRVSHHVTRMERRRLVQRVECAEDGRGAFIVITPEGRAAIEQAAPGHVNTVRRLVFDALTPEDIDAFATIIDKALAQLDNQAEDLRIAESKLTGPGEGPNALAQMSARAASSSISPITLPTSVSTTGG